MLYSYPVIHSKFPSVNKQLFGADMVIGQLFKTIKSVKFGDSDVMVVDFLKTCILLTFTLSEKT